LEAKKKKRRKKGKRERENNNRKTTQRTRRGLVAFEESLGLLYVPAAIACIATNERIAR
jgi:hypothetical protein